MLIGMTTMMERIGQDLTQAMRARDEVRTSVLRMAKTALTNKELEKKAPLDEAEAERVLQGLLKQREDSIEQFSKGGRQDLVDREKAEIAVLRAYVPEEASAEEIAAAVEQAAAETGASSPRDMGKLMKAALGALKGSGKPVDGKKVNEAVRRRLGG